MFRFGDTERERGTCGASRLEAAFNLGDSVNGVREFERCGLACD